MRVWSETDMCWLDVEVVSVGAHKVTSDEGWVQRYAHPLVAAKRFDVGTYPTVREMDKVKIEDGAAAGYNNRPKHWHRQGAVGRPKTPQMNRTGTCDCGRAKSVTSNKCTGCRLGRVQRPKRGPKAKAA